MDASTDVSDRTASHPKRVAAHRYLPSMICSITLDPFVDPVMAEDGHCYERVAIQHWLHIHKGSSPLTGQAMGSRLVPCHELRQAVDQYTERLLDYDRPQHL